LLDTLSFCKFEESDTVLLLVLVVGEKDAAAGYVPASAHCPIKFTICANGTRRMQVELRCAVLVIVAAGSVAPHAARYEAEVGVLYLGSLLSAVQLTNLASSAMATIQHT
jgi:hypothetical protein